MDTKQAGAMGGIARSNKQTPSQRSELARSAALARWKTTPHAKPLAFDPYVTPCVQCGYPKQNNQHWGIAGHDFIAPSSASQQSPPTPTT